MTGEDTDKYLELAVESEYDHCVTKHGGFKNHHEAYAVMREECEEVSEAFTIFSNRRKDVMQEIWKMIRKDEVGEDAVVHLEKLEGIAEELVKEGIQVMAMCRKWNVLLAKENE